MLTRICVWIGSWILVTGFLVWMAVNESQRSLAADPSAMAWVGFLPFLLPVFAFEAATFLVPIIIVGEFLLWLFFRFHPMGPM